MVEEKVTDFLVEEGKEVDSVAGNSEEEVVVNSGVGDTAGFPVEDSGVGDLVVDLVVVDSGVVLEVWKEVVETEADLVVEMEVVDSVVVG